MTEQERRFHAAINELMLQRDQAQARCANLAGDLAIVLAELESLKKPLDEDQSPSS